MNLRISNLNAATTPAQIVAHFSKYTISTNGEIYTIANVGKTKTRSFCYISIDDHSKGRQAIDQHNGSMLRDAIITVAESK